MSSWFGSSNSTIELDNKISEATSESIPNGELDLSVGLEITDLIRSKKYPPKQCMRSLKKRISLIYSNPNLLMSTLKLIDLCIKNSGYHFLVEISSKEFMDYFVDFIFKLHYNTKDESISNDNLDVGEFILNLVQTWSKLFKNQLQLNYTEKKYNELVQEGYKFDHNYNNSNDDNLDALDSSKFIDSEVPPDWIDSDSCMICYTPFSMLNRKHHCRRCGGVYCQTHSNNNVPLFNLGIMEPVRVCDSCFAKQKHHPKNVKSGTAVDNEDEDDELRRAIELSLKDTTISSSPPSRKKVREPTPPRNNNDDEEDEELKAALAASLQEYESQNKPEQYQSKEDSDDDAYNISIPKFDKPKPQSNFQPYKRFESSESSSPILQKPSHIEDLSQSEEEQINLFITLMNNVRNDTKKQENIMYDKDLNELYLKVVKLKPKLNRSLKNSVEKYQGFIHLNNKMNLINNLYNKFLDNTILQQNQQSQQYPQYPISQQTTGYDQYTNQPENNGYDQYPINQQHTGYEQTSMASPPQQHIPVLPTGYIYGQGTGYPTQESNYQQSLSHQGTGQAQQYGDERNDEYPLILPQNSGSQYRRSPQKEPTNVYPINLQPSEPDFEEEEDEQEERDEEEQPNSEQYHLSDIPVTNSNFIRRVSSSLPPNAVENASRKFPTLNDVEQEYDRNNTTGSKLDDLPKLPNNLEQFENTNESRQEYVKPEPEPLIEL